MGLPIFVPNGMKLASMPGGLDLCYCSELNRPSNSISSDGRI